MSKRFTPNGWVVSAFEAASNKKYLLRGWAGLLADAEEDSNEDTHEREASNRRWKHKASNTSILMYPRLKIRPCRRAQTGAPDPKT